MSKGPQFLLLYYDEFHTPVKKLVDQLGTETTLSILEVEIDFASNGNKKDTAIFENVEFFKEDGRDDFADGFIANAIRANACYQRGYNLSAALSRPFLATKVAAHLKEKGINNLIHGFAGNDQVRFEMAIMVLAPGVTIHSIAALLGSQNDVNKEKYTISSNIWGRSVEAHKLEDPWAAAEEEVFERVTPIQKCTAEPVTVELEFEKSIPVALNKQQLPLAAVLAELDKLAKPYYAGVSDMLEDGFVGLKTRAIYEYPAAFIIRCAHQDLESLVLTRKQLEFKAIVDTHWSALIYDGQWFDPQRRSLEAYIGHVSEPVTGTVKLVLSNGGAHVVARKSPFALYDKSRAIYRAGQDFGIGCSGYLAEVMSTQMQASATRNNNNPNIKEN